MSSSCDMECFFEKSREEAMKLKSLGNAHYKKQAYSKALQCYTKAILLSPHSNEDQKQFLMESMKELKLSAPSKHTVAEGMYSADSVVGGAAATSAGRDPLLSQCFGNRSAVLYEMKMYDECLLDIERALMLGFPPESAPKLRSRRDKCRAAQRREGRSSSSPSTDVSPAHNVSAFQSDAISVVSSPKLGRHMIAARDIRAGEIVISEESYASILSREFLASHCSHCFKKSPYSLLPCVLCACEGYCSTECRLKAWVRYHWMECKSSSCWRKDADWIEVLCLRIVVTANPADILNACKGLEVQGEYGFIHKLLSHEGKFNDGQDVILPMTAIKLNLRFGEKIRSMCSGIDGSSESGSGLEMVPLFLHHLCQLRCNTHSVSELVECGQDGEFLGSVVDPMEGMIKSIRHVSFGTVLLPTASLMNHSCAPNAIFRFEGHRVLVSVTQALKKGDEINNSYIPRVGRMTTAERRKELQERYFFHCQCPVCMGINPVVLLREAAREGLACLSCSTGALVQDQRRYICCLCKAVVPDRDIKKVLKRKKEAEDLLESAVCYGRVNNLELLLECQEVQTSIFHRHNLTLAHTNDLIAEVYASRGAAEMSLKFLKPSCDAIGVIFGKQSIEFGNEMQKLASVYFHSGEFKKALKAVGKAKEIITIHFGKSHPNIREMDEMVKTMKSLSC